MLWGLQQKMCKCRKSRAGSGAEQRGMKRMQFHRSGMGSSWFSVSEKSSLIIIMILKSPHYLTAPNGSTSSQNARFSLLSRLSGISSPPDPYWKVSLSQMTSINPANVNGWNIFKGVPLVLAATGLFCLSEWKQRNAQFILNNVHLS